MMASKSKYGFTLLEMLVVVGVIAVLAAAVLVITRRVESQSKEQTLANTFAVLEGALGQFRDYGYTYAAGSPYEGLTFPLDCTGFSTLDVCATIQKALGATKVQVVDHADSAGRDYLDYSGCEVLYFFLSQVPEAAAALKGVNSTLTTNANGQGRPVEILIDGRLTPFTRIVDPWGTTLRYQFYDVQPVGHAPIPATEKSFPILISAGPDKTFGTADDISSKGR